jgi:phosphoribosyl 1,2-cyclic phosphodiesterase
MGDSSTGLESPDTLVKPGQAPNAGTPCLRFAVLGSGSEGNALVLECRHTAQTTRLLLDCGFSAKELDKRLAVVGLQATDLHAVLITHEHHDHAAGAYRVAKRWRLPLYATHGTLCAAYNESAPEWINHPLLSIIKPDAPFVVGQIAVHPIAVPHDAREPVQYRFAAANRHFAVLTDAGHASAHLRAALHGLHAMVLECNHDVERLQQSSYPPSLKQRIGGDWGHLSNLQAAQLLQSLDNTQLNALWCAHLSQSNNTPELAQAALAQAIGWEAPRIGVLDQAKPGQWFTV